MATPKDRLNKLLDAGNTALNGLDYVEIASGDQTTLRVHFLNPVSIQGTLGAVTISGGETSRTVPVLPIDEAADWAADAAGRPVLTLRVLAPGDFSRYTLTIVSPRLDSYFARSDFSFKALCPSDLDCAPDEEPCPPPAGDAPPIDYLAKDFLSFRKALLDFSALRYPAWVERSEADFGMMALEALSALADDLSYTQDRVAAEATLQTATQRRSIVRHARLVDYEPRPATAARLLLQLDVTGPAIPSGLPVAAQGPDGGSIPFETGAGLIDPATGRLAATVYPVNPAWNRGLLVPYVWDDGQLCLRRGATELWVEGHGFAITPGTALLIDTAAATPADPPLRAVVHVTEAIEEADPLFPGPPAPPTPVTHLRWAADEALARDHDLDRTRLAGNLVPATQGRRAVESFAIDAPPPAAPDLPLATVRTGPNGTPLYLYSPRHAPLVWLAEDEGDAVPQPEAVLEQVPPGAAPIAWTWRRRLLEAQTFERAFAVEPARYRPIARTRGGALVDEYDGDDGATLRFGDGVFGEMPDAGAVFRLTYRVGGGAVGNVAADAVTRVEPGAAASIAAVTNPFAAVGGADEEPDERVRRLAPQAFRARQFRAVRPADYEAAAERLPWVQRAGTVFRWTGSWLTVFTTADPSGSDELPVARHTELIDLLNRQRLAGYESHVPTPRYAALDLLVRVCARADAFQGDVRAAVLARLGTERLPDGTTGFFHVDNFTFGTPLERSRLEAAVQSAEGVAGVVGIAYRRRGLTPTYLPLPETVRVKPDEILRLDGDPNRPERGALRVLVEGGK